MYSSLLLLLLCIDVISFLFFKWALFCVSSSFPHPLQDEKLGSYTLADYPHPKLKKNTDYLNSFLLKPRLHAAVTKIFTYNIEPGK